MANTSKSWERPWSIEEIIENAPNWSLAGDVGLLKHLESFSEDLLLKAEEVNTNLNGLLNGLNKASLSLDVVKNEFGSLHNTQFIENRVYEDDETIHEEKQSDEADHRKINEEERMTDMKEAVLKGIQVVEKYFEKVEIPESDSEDETDFPSFVLRPKDPYMDRPLPYVIGSEEWYKKWHVGLLDSSSDSETEKVSEKFSESDSDSDSFNIKQIKSKAENGATSQGIGINHPAANSTFHESIMQNDFEESSGSEGYNSVPIQAPLSNKNFAQELADKLGDVLDQNVTESQINKRPIQKTSSNNTYGSKIFFDEPPPIDEDDDDLFGNNKGQLGIFSGTGGLFDDLEDDNYLIKKDDTKKSSETLKSLAHNLFDDEDDEQNNFNITSKQSKKYPEKIFSKGISGGLFDDEDDDLFVEKVPVIKPQTDYLKPANKPTIPFFENEPPELSLTPPKISDTERSKKPVGGVKIFEGADIFGTGDSRSSLTNKISDQKSQIQDYEIEHKEVHIGNTTPTENKEKHAKQLSLFDDDNSALFEDDLFSDIFSKKFTSSLFNSQPLTADIFVEDIAKSKVSSEENAPEKSTQKLDSSSLFVDSDDSDSHDLFPHKTRLSNSADFEENKPISIPSKESQIIKEKSENNSQQAQLNRYNINLFEDHPPEDDDEWDSKSETNVFEENDYGLFNNASDISTVRSGLFDNEPPSLFNETSGIVRDVSTRAETDDSFNPYASSSRRFSIDIFNDQQNNDSFFVTKNKSQIDTHANLLNSIPELSNGDMEQSNLEITPSGNIEDIYSPSTTVSIDSKYKVDNTLDYDIFSDKLNLPSEKNSSKSIPEKPLEDSKGNLFQTETVKSKPTIPKRSIPLPQESSNKAESKLGSPGKLKHNLSINVKALIPGVSPPKRKELEKSHSFEVAASCSLDNFQTLNEVSKSNEELTQSIKKPEEKSVHFDLPPDSSEVLLSVTKDRAKIPIKRRPSTRKARHESLRNSIKDFNILLEPKPDSLPNINIQKEESQETIKSDSNFVDIFDDNRNLFTPILTERTEGSIETNANVTVGNMSSISIKQNLKLSNLFDESEDFDDMFSSTKKLSSKSELSKKFLFDDEPDDDDIFGPPISSKTNKVSMDLKPPETKPQKLTPQVKKLENLEALHDPLSSFIQSED